MAGQLIETVSLSAEHTSVGQCDDRIRFTPCTRNDHSNRHSRVDGVAPGGGDGLDGIEIRNVGHGAARRRREADDTRDHTQDRERDDELEQ